MILGYIFENYSVFLGYIFENYSVFLNAIFENYSINFLSLFVCNPSFVFIELHKFFSLKLHKMESF